jgi:hypothetical protein
MDVKLATVVDELNWFTFRGKHAGAARWTSEGWGYGFFEHMFER